MYDELKNAAAQLQQGGLGSTISPYQPSLKENYQQQLEQAKKSVSRIEEILKLLDENPSVGRILELMGRSY
jgi:hypothetical protein